MSIKTILACGAITLLAADVYAQANHNTTRSNRTSGGIAAPVDTGAGNLQGHVTLVKSSGSRLSPVQEKVAEGDGGTFVSGCGFVAAPQGFVLSTMTRDYSPAGGLKTDILVNQVVPWSFAGSPAPAPVGLPGSPTDPGPSTLLAHNLGQQTATNGVHPSGGWAHANTGAAITGTVYHVRGKSAGQPYTGGYHSFQFAGGSANLFGTSSCTTSALNSAISKLNQQVGSNIPVINAASQAYNDTGPGSGISGPSGNDWAGDLYEAYYAETGYPGWVFPEGGISASSGGVGVVNMETAASVDLATPNPEATKIDRDRIRERPKPRQQRR